jgi:hypothetical protein
MPASRSLSSAVLAAAATAGLIISGSAPVGAAVVPDPIEYSAEGADIAVTPIGSHDTAVFDESAAEIVEFYAPANRLFVVNAAAPAVEVLDASDPTAPTPLFDLEIIGVVSEDGSVVPAGAIANSVAIRDDGLGVVAVESDVKTDNGWVVFFDAAGEGSALGAVRVGALPDMVTITPNGRRAVVADEAEPAEDYSVDPEGSIAVIALPRGVELPAQSAVSIAGFHAFEGDALPAGIRIYGGREDAGTGVPEFPVSENLEPEYVAVSRNSRRAHVTLQEANGIAVVNLRRAKVTDIWPLGTVDHMEVPFDASDEDGAVNLATWPVQSYRLPDAVASFRTGGRTYLVTADEGDARDWEDYSEEVRVDDLGDDGLAPVCESVAEQAGMTLDELTDDENLGRLKITKAQGLRADGSCYETLYAFGGRGFSVWTTHGELVSSTGDGFEAIIAAAVPDFFNSDHGTSSFDDRSDDKGPEPEGVTIGRVGGRVYAFVALERVGGIMAYDVSDPAAPAFVTYVNNRNFDYSGEDLPPEDLFLAGDLGPEGVAFVKRRESPSDHPMLAVANEVSGSTTLFDVSQLDPRR